MVARHREQFEEIADLHRGETVLVVGHQCALGIVVPALARNLTPAWTRDNDLANTESVELENDADGWMLSRWGSVQPGARVRCSGRPAAPPSGSAARSSRYRSP